MKNQIWLVVGVVIMVIILVMFAWRKRREGFQNCNNLEIYVIDSGVPGPCIGLLGGVHGNEPAGSEAFHNLINGTWDPQLSRGKLMVIPSANQCGLENNNRMHPTTIGGLYTDDLNRKFTENGAIGAKAQKVLNALKDCDFVIDIHEGWGFHITQPTSLGSTVSPTNQPLAKSVAQVMVTDVNSTITKPKKHFTVLNNISCDIPSTISCYMEHQGRNYVLVEITGQNDIQPLWLREQQARTLVNSALAQLGMVH